MNDDTAVLKSLGLHGDQARGGEPAAADDENRDDGLAGELAKVAPKKWWNKGTVVLGAAVLLAGGFVGGLQAQKHWGTATTATAGFPGAAGGARGGTGRTGYGGTGGYGNFGGGAPGGTGQQGAQAQASAAPAASGTTGTVKLVDGNTIYIQTADGNVVTVKVDAKTSVKTATSGKVSDVKAGQSITVEGAAGTDGTVAATSVTATKK